ncbi:MAG TPA: c-type cytochrome [Blastocatellia bacterium]
MKGLKMMLLVCSSAILLYGCANGPADNDSMLGKKGAQTPPPPPKLERPTPMPGTNAGLGMTSAAGQSPNPTQAPQKMSDSDRAEAAKLYTTQGCIQCHGDDGKGIMQGCPDFTSKGWQMGARDEQLANTVKNGHPPMPAYGSRLSADQIATLVGYLHTFKK